MTNPDIEALAAKADRGPWLFDKSTGQIYMRPDPLTKYIIAEMESSNDANGELIVALVNSLTAPIGITAPEWPPIMLDIAAASETDEMWKRRWLALCQKYERDPCFVDSNGKWGLRDFLDYAAEVCGFIASPTTITALRSTTAEPGEDAPAEGELLPCPFCGGEAEMSYYTKGTSPEKAGYYIECGSCSAGGEPFDVQGEMPGRDEYTQSKAIAAWNQRTHDSAAKDAELAEAAQQFLWQFDTIRADELNVRPEWDRLKAALANRGEAGSLAKERSE